MKSLNVAVWGLGPHAIKNILPALEICEGITLYGVCSRSVDIVAAQASARRCLGWNDPAKMLENPDVDIVFLATPIGLHAVHGKAILAANKHLWCEKPLAMNLEEASELAVLSRTLQLSVAEGFMYLYHPQFSRLAEILDSRLLGDIRSVTCRFGLPPLARPGFRTSAELGGGAFLDVGCYPASAITSLFPGLTLEVLASEIRRAPGSAVDVDGRATLRCGTGAVITLDWGLDRAYRNEIDIWGDKGSVSTDRIFSKPAEYVPQFRFLDLNGRENLEPGRPGNHFLTMFEAFRKLIDDPAKAEYERGMIVRRAQLMDEIAKNASGS
jgi:dTDP-3,4-didehydro-2,6-dideoxy-alpha-D-glucose 3-reductase